MAVGMSDGRCSGNGGDGSGFGGRGSDCLLSIVYDDGSEQGQWE